jgi:hypothetical protein
VQTGTDRPTAKMALMTSADEVENQGVSAFESGKGIKTLSAGEAGINRNWAPPGQVSKMAALSRSARQRPMVTETTIGARCIIQQVGLRSHQARATSGGIFLVARS